MGNIIMRSNIRDDRPTCAALYHPTMDCISPSIIGYFVISDDWSEQALLALKEKAEADFLVGIQTDKSEYKHLFKGLNLMKSIIKCQPDQVEDVIKLLDIYSPRYENCLNAYDIKSLFECGKVFKFIQISATGNSEADLIKVATQHLASQLSNVGPIRGLFVNPESSAGVTLAGLAYISEVIESICNGTEGYYSSSITHEPNYFRLRAIYA